MPTVCWPARQYFPATHGVHVAALAAEKVPAAQGMAATAPVGQ